MVLPLILGAIALGAGAVGVSKGVEGANSISQAGEKSKNAISRFNRRKKRLEARADFVNTEAEAYGILQRQVREDVFCRVAVLLESIGRRANVNIYDLLSGAEVPVPGVRTDDNYQLKAESVLQGFLVAAGASAVSSAATTGAVTMFATASTGAAISGLSGAAANSALLAALGGGSLAAGGGGMALGSLVLGGITVGPAIAVGGLAIAAEGEKALTKATELEGEVEKAVAEMSLKEELLDGIHLRLVELSAILTRLKEQALGMIPNLESLAAQSAFDVNSEDHMKSLQALLMIIGSLAQVMRTPIIGEDGDINPDIDIVIKKVSA